MKLIERYLLSEYLKAVFFCIISFCMIYIVWDMLGHISRLFASNAPWLLVAKFYGFMLAPSLVLLVPASLLLATLYTLWQFSRTNQLVAMRACGLSMAQIMRPFVCVGIFFSLLILLINETLVSDMAIWAREFSSNQYRVRSEQIVTDVRYINSLDRRLWVINSLDAKKPHILNGVRITQEKPDNIKVWEISAGRAEWLDGVWWFFDVVRKEYRDDGNPLGGPKPVEGTRLGRPWPELKEKPADLIADLKPEEYLSAREIWRYLKKNPGLSKYAKAEKSYDFHKHLAMPWACLVVTLFAIPAGTKSSRQSILIGILLAVGFFLGFYALSQFGLYMGKQRHIAPWLGAWLSNLVFFIVGMIMSMKIR